MAKERKLLRNGDIVEFPLPFENNYGYAKFVDLKIGNPDSDYFNPFRWFVYNYFSENRIDNILHILNRDLLCNPLLMYWTKNINTLEGWRIIENEQVSEEEYRSRYLRFIPNSFFQISPHLYADLNWICCLEPNDSLNREGNWVEYPYDHVRHLEGSGSSPVINLPIRAFLERCKILNIQFDVTKLTKGEWIAGYLQCIDKPAYNLIPDKYRQRPIPKNVDWKWSDSSRIYFNYFDAALSLK
jgi:hypothetical protein